MASKFIPLDDAARMLGVSPERLVELRSNGEIRGFRDGKSWKFPESEIERLLAEEGVDVQGDADAGESSILVTEQGKGTGVGKSGSTVIGAEEQGEEGSGHGSDVGVGDEGVASGSDVAVVAHRSGGSDVRLVASGDSGELQVEPSGDEVSEKEPQRSPSQESNAGDEGAADAGGEAPAAAGEGGDELRLMDDEDLMADLSPSGAKPDAPGENVLSDDNPLGPDAGGTGDLIHGDSDVELGGEAASGSDATPVSQDDDDLVIASEDEDDDLVLSGGSDVSVAGDSGINLMSPSDSGLSLEGEPLDLAGSSISALDLGNEAKAGDEAGSGAESGSLVDFQADEEFQLSPSGVGLETDEDSGSQVIEVDDSAEAFGDEDEFGDAAVVEDVGGFDDVAMVGDDALVADEGFGGEEEGFAAPSEQGAYAGARPAYEVPYSPLQVATLVCILLVLCVGGMMMTDLVRNLAGYAGETAPVSSLTDAILGMLGMNS